jgi:hypothetical protein
MEIPPGFSLPETTGKVCRLNKSLYGLNSLREPSLTNLGMQFVTWDTDSAMVTIQCFIDTLRERLHSCGVCG